jgi:nucleotide-binding universal stress UspA family protein
MLLLISGGAGVNPWKRILYATDLSSASRAAFRRAVHLGRRHGAELIVVHVVFPISAYEVSVIGSPAFCEVYEAAARRAGERTIAALVASARRRGVRARGLMVQGDAGREIPRWAASLRVDVIVMGASRRHGLRRLLFGSTPDAVIRRAPCPVLTVGVGQGVRRRPHGRGRRIQGRRPMPVRAVGAVA